MTAPVGLWDPPPPKTRRPVVTRAGGPGAGGGVLWQMTAPVGLWDPPPPKRVDRWSEVQVATGLAAEVRGPPRTLPNPCPS